MQKEEENILIEGSKIMGINLNNNHIESFSRYLRLLSKWNKKINLTSLEDSQEIIIKHFLDSLSCFKVIKIHVNIDKFSVIDVGTGAGFPSIPIKIVYPALNLFLLETKRKKANFLAELVKELELKQVEIFKERAETLGKSSDYREKYDIVISRAVASLNILCEYCLPLVKIGGLFLAQKGRSYKEELESGLKTVKLLGGELIKLENVQIPFLNQERYILVIKKIKNTPLKYPRKAGIPQKRPLYS